MFRLMPWDQIKEVTVPMDVRKRGDTVDGRIPKQPPGMDSNLVNNGINYLSTG